MHKLRQPSHRAWTLVLASLGVFMTALDTLVVTTALPVLRVDLHASLSSLEWTVNAYNLAFACFLLTGAALGDRFGRKRMFTVGLSVFTAASAASALAPSVGALVAARAQPAGRASRCSRRSSAVALCSRCSSVGSVARRRRCCHCRCSAHARSRAQTRSASSCTPAFSARCS